MQENYELVKFVDGSFELEVNVSPSEDTVWLSQEQMAYLFSTTKQNISLHISNIYKEKELNNRTVKDFLTVQVEGKRTIKRSVRVYNLDMIISVGFRVKSQRGIVFRKWATSVLKSYMLKGYAIEPSRVLVTHENYLDLVNVVNRIDSTQTDLIDRVERLEDKYPDLGIRIFFKGQMWDATNCIEQIIEQAEREIILIDSYVDRRTLDMLSRKKAGVTVSIFTSVSGNRITEKESNDFNAQYPSLEVRETDKFHDRFLIIDRKHLYHIGASIKDSGKKAFEISINEDDGILKGILSRLYESGFQSQWILL